MKKKLGISIIVGVIILVCVLGVAGIIYSGFTNVYGANTRDDFSFAKENGTVKKYVFPLGDDFQFNMILPQGVNKEDVVLSEADNKKLLKIQGDTVIGVKVGTGILKATVKINGKTYETSTTFTTRENDFYFTGAVYGMTEKYVVPIEKNKALTIGNTYKFDLKIPSGYTKDDIQIFESSANKVKVDNDAKTITPKSSGTIEIMANIKGTEKYAAISYEVSSKNGDKNNNSNSNNTSSGVSNTLNKIYFEKSQKSRITTYLSNNSTLGAYVPTTSGIKKTDLEWTSSNENVAKIKDNTGRLTITGSGETIITASCEAYGISDSYTLTVYPENLSVINQSNKKEINNTTITLNINDTMQIAMSDKTLTINNSDLVYTSSNGKVCSVDENGNIKAINKGTVTIKGMLKENNKTSGQVRITVVGSKEEAMLKGTFAFATDPETKKQKQYTGQYALVVDSPNNPYEFNMIVPEGAEGYPIEYSCSNKNIVEINGESVKAIKPGVGTLTAKIMLGTKYKTASTKIQVVANEEEKQKAMGNEAKYLNLDFENDTMAIQVGNVVNLKPTVETNIAKKDYTLLYSASDTQMVELNEKTGRVKPLKAGKVDITAYIKEQPENKATITLEILDKIELVSLLKLATELPKKSGYYQIAANQPYTIHFDVLPDTATFKDYTLEVDNTEDFIVIDKTVTALKVGAKTKLTAKASDSGGRETIINLESVISDSELNSLQSILDNKEITVKIGETLNFRNVQNVSKKVTISRATKNNSFTLKYDEDLVTIIGKNKGNGTLTVNYNNKKEVINIKVVEDSENGNTPNQIAVTGIEFPIDPNTAKTKDYVNDYRFVVGECYEVSKGVTVYPLNATNRDVTVRVSDTKAFTVTPEGNVIANQPNKTATLTVTSVSNPSIHESVKIASTASEITSIKFVQSEYVLDINENNHPWDFNLIISTANGQTFDPSKDYSITNNSDYQRLKNQIVLESSNQKALQIINSQAHPVQGVRGKGNLTAYVKDNRGVSATTHFEMIGVPQDITIASVKFAKSQYEISVEDWSMGFCPIITLSNGKVLDSTKEHIRTSEEYKGYLSQLELVKIPGLKSGLQSTGELVKFQDIDEGELGIRIYHGGKCELGVKLKDSDDVLATTILNITDTKKEAEENKLKAEISEIDHSTTTNNKNLKITNIKFASNSYELTGDFGYNFNPIISLSDGTKIDSNSQNQDVYKYYVGLTELLLVNDIYNSEIDFGVVEVVNKEVPRKLIPLKNGKVTLAVALKSTGMVYDKVPVTVKIN